MVGSLKLSASGMENGCWYISIGKRMGESSGQEVWMSIHEYQWLISTMGGIYKRMYDYILNHQNEYEENEFMKVAKKAKMTFVKSIQKPTEAEEDEDDEEEKEAAVKEDEIYVHGEDDVDEEEEDCDDDGADQEQEEKEVDEEEEDGDEYEVEEKEESIRKKKSDGNLFDFN